MTAIERLKRKVVSRLLGEVDITYFKDAIDGKVAKLAYKDREIFIEKRDKGYILFLGYSKEYTYRQEYLAGQTMEQAIAGAINIIKEDEVFGTMMGR